MAKRPGNGTRSVHQRVRLDPATRAIVPPMVQSSAFAFPDLETWEKVATTELGEDVHSSVSNPTVTRFIDRVAGLEGAEAACAFATGMGAVNTTLMALLEPGSRMVTVRDAYGAISRLFTEVLPRWGVETVVCSSGDLDAIEAEIREGADLLYVESPTNPTLRILDLERLCGVAGEVDALSVVDNTLATPINQTPLSLGADLVLHTATEYLCGMGDALGGVVCGSRERIDQIDRHRQLTGATLDAQTASLLLRSLRTLGLRVERQNETALGLAEWLQQHDEVEEVLYPGLPGHPGHEVAARQMTGFGGVLSFTLGGGMARVREVLPRLRLAWLAPSLGQVDTVVGPAHLALHPDRRATREKESSAVPDHLVRYSCGIEDLDDLRADLEQALAAPGGPAAGG